MILLRDVILMTAHLSSDHLSWEICCLYANISVVPDGRLWDILGFNESLINNMYGVIMIGLLMMW